MVDNVFLRPDLPATEWSGGKEYTLEFCLPDQQGEITDFGEVQYVPLIGLEGQVADVEVRGDWAAIKLAVDHNGEEWDASLMIHFESVAPDWLKIGSLVKVTEEGLKYIGFRITKKIQS